MSIRYQQWPLTNYPDALDKSNPNIRQNIINFEDRTPETDARLYYVLANDVRSLQQAVFAIEETLGVNPQSSFNTVNDRISALEDYTDLDERYGGATWRSIYLAHLADPSKPKAPTIMGHVHDGSATGAPKIDLALHTTGKLDKGRLDLSGSGALTGEDIRLNRNTTQTVAAKFDDKLDKVGGTIQGTNAYLTINGPFNCYVYKEAEAYQCVPSSGAVGTNIADTGAFSGTARKATSSNAKGNVMHYSSKLRYGNYSLCLRMKVSNRAPLQSIGKVKICSGSTVMKQVEIIPARFQTTDYEMFYVAFEHKGNPTVNVYIEWYGTSVQPVVACDLTIDSLVITPLHVTTYDLE